MSFIKRAQEAAKGAAEQAQHAAELARTRATEAAAAANRTANDPATQERLSRQAKEAMGMARRGISTVVERIDPATLADLIIKATALQEMTNASLRKKGSPYRISEIGIEASIPPGVTFAIGRIDDPEEAVAGETVSSAKLVEGIPDTGEAVIALDGTVAEHAVLAEQVALAEPTGD